MRVFEVLFKAVSTRFLLRTIEKYLEIRISSFVPSSKIFVWEAYILQTKIFEDLTNRWESTFKVLVKGVSTLFGQLEKTFGTVGSAFQKKSSLGEHKFHRRLVDS